MAEDDTENSALISDHHFSPRDGNSWGLCAACGIGMAGHRWHSDFGGKVDTSGDSERLHAAVEDTQRGVKYDQDKTRWDVIPFKTLEEIAWVMTYGAEKYATHNWRKGMKWSRLFSAATRHLTAWWLGEDNDEETGKSHLAHAVCCILMLRDSQMHKVGEEDRDSEWK